MEITQRHNISQARPLGIYTILLSFPRNLPQMDASYPIFIISARLKWLPQQVLYLVGQSIKPVHKY